MADWQEIADAGFAVPAGADRDSLAAELAEALADPDPRIRDGAAYATLATWIEKRHSRRAAGLAGRADGRAA